jgi:outer membrane receptor protein involved in Fe transport
MVCALGSGTLAHAQGQGLEEIVVTARKTAEALQDTPVSVTAFTAETITERQIVDMNDIARFTPGLVFDRAFGRATERPVIRGQGNVLAGVQFGVEAGAAYFVDGIYYPGDIQSLDINEVERVEVIRGPQSALYGRNTYSGAINFITRSPGEEFGADVKASFDEDEQNYTLRFEGPLTETLSGSISARYYDFKGQWTNELTGEDIGQEESTNVGGVLEWKPSDELRFRVRGAYTEDRDGTRAFMFQDASFNNCYPGTRSLAYYATAPANSTSNQYFCGEIKPRKVYLNTTKAVTNLAAVQPGAPGVLPNTVIGAPQPGAPAGSTATFDLRPGIAFSGVERDLTLVSALGEWDIQGSGYTLLVDGAWRTEDRLTGSDSDFSSVNTFTSTAALGGESGGANTGLDEYDDYSFEIKFSSPTDRDLRWMVGAFYYEQEQRFYDVNFAHPEGRSVANSVADTYNTSIFGLVEWRFTDTWSATVEGRYMEEEKSLFEFCTTVIAGVVPVCTARPTGNPARPPNFVDNPGFQQAFNQQGKWTKFTPRVTLQWRPNSDLNFYANYAEGVKPGGFNGTGGLQAFPQLPEYDQETSDNYELGMKSTWLGGTLSFNIAAFFIDATDVQLTTPIVRADGSAVTSVASNQGSGEIKGFEIEARWRIFDPLTASFTFARADSEFTEGCDDFQWALTSGGGNNPLRPGAFNPANPALGGTNLNGQGDCSIKGNPFPLSAKDTASFALDYRTPIYDGGYEFFVNADVSYTGKRPVQVHDDPYVPSATIIGARIGIAADTWSAALYGRNLGDEDSVAVATRWLSQPYVGFSTAPIPGTTPLKNAAALAAAGLPAYPPATGSSAGLNSVASYALPRGFFAALRRERQIGIELSYSF